MNLDFFLPLNQQFVNIKIIINYVMAKQDSKELSKIQVMNILLDVVNGSKKKNGIVILKFQ